jgi:hypothetical protein
MYLLFAHLEDFNTWNEFMNQQLALPNDEGTQTYSVYISSTISNDILAYFDDRADTSRMTLINYDQAVEMGFFPAVNV